ncbi:MAG: cyclic nucleotide-binding domain-containing protein [Thermoanaerobaculia bacterium]
MVKPVFKATKTKTTQATYSVEFKAGECVFEEGDLGTEMYIIQDGEVAIFKQLRGEEKQLTVLSRGDFFGEMSVLEDLPRTAAARVESDCRLLEINSTTFDQMLRKNPEIAVRMMRKLSRRLRETDKMLRQALGSEYLQAPEMPSPQAVPTPGKGPERLIHDQTGTEFYLSEGDETSIGRRDPVTGINPDIDLTPADSQRSISRRHAKIFRRNDKYYVREEIGTMNGTFVNSERIETGLPVEFEDGDEVRFGLIKTIFHAH